MFFVASRRGLYNVKSSTFTRGQRAFASNAAGAGGSGFFQRLSSFLTGAGLTALVTQFYIFKEIQDSNEAIITKQKELEKRLADLEGK